MVMVVELAFTEEFRYRDDPSGVTIPVWLTFGKEDIRVFAKIDTGSEVCLFSYEIGLKLGVPIETGTPGVLNSLGGPLDAFGHEVVIQSGHLCLESFVYFAKYRGLPRNILGRQGWLRNLRLGLVDYDNLLYLSAYDS